MAEFGWTRAQVSAAYSLMRLEGGVEGPWGGMVADKHGPRIVALVGNIIAGTGLCLLYFMNSLWQYIIIWAFIVSLGFNLGTMDPLEKAISDWFVKKRGLALGLGRVGLALGGTIGPPLMTMLLINLGWRTAFVIAGCVTWIIGIPLSWFFVKPHRPEYYGLMPDGAKVESDKAIDTEKLVKAGQELAAEMGEIELTLRQALRTRAFWIYVIEFVMIGFILSSINVHLIPHLTDMGVDPLAAATAVGFMTLMSTPFRFIIGPVCERISVHSFKYVRMLADGFRTAGLFLFMISKNMTMVYISAVVYGVGLGISTGSMSPLRGRFFGRKAFSTIHGTATMLSLPGTIIAPIYVGWIYDTTSSYIIAFTQACLLGVIAVVIQLFLKPPKKPEVIETDLKKFL